MGSQGVRADGVALSGQPVTGLVRRLVLCTLLAVMAWGLFALPWAQTLQERSRDSLTPLSVEIAALEEILVVEISEQTLLEVGSWPWPRARLADLVEELLGPLGARAVALDMVLPAAADVSGDARLASLTAHAPLVLARVLDLSAERPALAVDNHAGLTQARCAGHIGVRVDDDGVLRRIQLSAVTGAQRHDSLALALLRCAQPQRAVRAASSLSADSGGAWRIPFRVGLDAFTTLRAQDVLAGRADPLKVRNRYVLVGSSAVGLSDYVATPLQPVTAGVLVHAQVLAELMRAVTEPPPLKLPPWLEGAALLAGTTVLCFGLMRGLLWGVMGWVTVSFIWLLACRAAFAHGWGPEVLGPLAGFGTFTATWLLMDLNDSRRASRQALATLSQYVAAPVLRLLVRQGLRNSLVPSRQSITVMVADMANYTRMTASSSLEDSARLTKEFLEAITAPVLACGGTLDRYTGDGLIAFWGAPLVTPDHAQRCVDAALQMFDALAELNVRRRERGVSEVAMRIGIESGEALVGDLGSSSRSVYTAVGNCINLASRLQDAARDMGQALLVGPIARAAVAAPLQALGSRQIRGIEQPLEVFGLSGGFGKPRRAASESGTGFANRSSGTGGAAA